MIPEIILLKGEEDRLLTNHPWIYNNEIYSDDVSAEAGSIVDVLNSKKKFLGRGFYNPHSKIRVRILTREKDEINQDFLKKRILSFIIILMPDICVWDLILKRHLFF